MKRSLGTQELVEPEKRGPTLEKPVTPPKLSPGFYSYLVVLNVLKLYGFDAPTLVWEPFENPKLSTFDIPIHEEFRTKHGSSTVPDQESLFSKRHYLPISPYHGRFFGVCSSGTYGFLVPMLLRHPIETDSYCFVACKISFHYDPRNMLLETSNNLAYSNTSSDFMLFPSVRLIDAFIVRNPSSCKHCKAISNIYRIFNKDDSSISLVDGLKKASNLESTNDYKIYTKMTCCPTDGPKIPPPNWWFFWFSLIKSTINMPLEENPFVSYYHLSSSVDGSPEETLDFGTFCKRSSGNLDTDGHFYNTMFKDVNAFIIFSVNRNVFNQIEERSKKSGGGSGSFGRFKLPHHVNSEMLSEMLWKEIGLLFSKQTAKDIHEGTVSFVIPTECFPFSFTFFEMSDNLLTTIHNGGGFTILSHLLSKIPETLPSFINNSGHMNMKKQNSVLRDSYLVHSSDSSLAKESTFFVHSSTSSSSLSSTNTDLHSGADSFKIGNVYFRKRYQMYNNTNASNHNQSSLHKSGKILFLVTLDKKKFLSSLLKFTSSNLLVVLMWFWDVLKISAMEEYSRIMTFIRHSIMTAKKPETIGVPSTPNTNTSSSNGSSSKTSGGADFDLRQTLKNMPSTFQYQLIPKISSLEYRLKKNYFLDGVIMSFQNFDSDCNLFVVNPLLSPREQEDRIEFLIRFTAGNLVSSYQDMKSVVDSIDFKSLLVHNNQLASSSSVQSQSASTKSENGHKKSLGSSAPVAKLSSSSSSPSLNKTDIPSRLSSGLPSLKQRGFKMSSSFMNAPSNPNSFQTDFNILAAARDLIRVYFFQKIYAVRALHVQKVIHSDLHRSNFLTFSAPTIFRTKFSFYQSTYNTSNSPTSFCEYFLVPFGNPKVVVKNGLDNVHSDSQNLFEIVAIPSKYFPQTTIVDLAEIRMSVFSDDNFFVGDALYTKNKLTDFIEFSNNKNQTGTRTSTCSGTARTQFQKDVESNFLLFLNSYSLGKSDSSYSRNGLNIPRSVVYNCSRNYISRRITENLPESQIEPFFLTRTFCLDKLNTLLVTNSADERTSPSINSINIFRSKKIEPLPGDTNNSGDTKDSNKDSSTKCEEFHYSFVNINDFSEYFVALVHGPTNAFNSRSPEQFEVLLDKAKIFAPKNTAGKSDSENNISCCPYQPLSNMADIYSLGVQFMYSICGFDPIFSVTSLTFRRQESLSHVTDTKLLVNLFITNSNMKVIILPKSLSLPSVLGHSSGGFPNRVAVLGNAFKTKVGMAKESGLAIFKIFQQLSPSTVNDLKKQSVLSWIDYKDTLSEFTSNFSLQFPIDGKQRTTILFDFLHGFLPENFRVLSIGFSNDTFMRDFCSPKTCSLPRGISLRNADVHFSKMLVKTIKSLLVKYCIDSTNDLWIVSVANPVLFKNVVPTSKEEVLNESANALLMRIDSCGLPEMYQNRLLSSLEKVIRFFSCSTFFEDLESRLESIKSNKIFAPLMRTITTTTDDNKDNKVPPVQDPNTHGFFFTYSILKPKHEHVIDRLFSGFLPYWMDKEGPLSRQNPEKIKSSHPNSDYLSQPVGTLDIVFKVITNSVFEVFLQYVLIEAIFIGLGFQDKKVLADFETTIQNGASKSFCINLDATSVMTYGCKILTELGSFVKLAGGRPQNTSDKNPESREKRPSTLEFIKLNNRNRLQQTDPNHSTKCSFWTLFIESDQVPSSVLYNKLVTFGGYAKPTLKNFLQNRFGFDQNSTETFSSLVADCLSWDPFHRCSTLELLHSSLFDVLKLPKSSFDIVPTSSVPVNEVDQEMKSFMVQQSDLGLDCEHVLSIDVSQLPILCQNTCSGSVNMRGDNHNKHYEPVFSSDCVSRNYQFSNKNHPLLVSAKKSIQLKRSKSFHTVENIFNTRRSLKFPEIVIKLGNFISSFQKSIIKNKQNGFYTDPILSGSLPELTSWIRNNIGNIMWVYGRYVNNRHCEFPALPPTYQHAFFRIIVQTGLLSPLDQVSLFNSFYSNFFVLPVSADAGGLKHKKDISDFSDFPGKAKDETTPDIFYVGPLFVGSLITEPTIDSQNDEDYDRKALMEKHIETQITTTIESSSRLLSEFLVFSFLSWIEGRHDEKHDPVTFHQFITKNYPFFLDNEKYVKILEDDA